jgi:hypothetical protein
MAAPLGVDTTLPLLSEPPLPLGVEPVGAALVLSSPLLMPIPLPLVLIALVALLSVVVAGTVGMVALSVTLRVSVPDSLVSVGLETIGVPELGMGTGLRALVGIAGGAWPVTGMMIREAMTVASIYLKGVIIVGCLRSDPELTTILILCHYAYLWRTEVKGLTIGSRDERDGQDEGVNWHHSLIIGKEWPITCILGFWLEQQGHDHLPWST